MLINGVDIGFVDRNGCNALHIASAAGYQDIVDMVLLYWSKEKIKAAKKKKIMEMKMKMSLEPSAEKIKESGADAFEIDCVDNS